MRRVSAIVNTLNEEHRLRECLESLRWADEIVLVDMHSEDQTREVAESFGCRVLLHERLEHVEPARQFSVDAAEHDWVLVVDPDERVSSGLADWIRSQSDSSEVNGFRIPRRNHYGTRWMKCCGWFPDAQLRLYNRQYASYSDRMHRGLTIEGKVETLPAHGEAYLNHMCFDSLEDRFGSINRYSSIVATDLGLSGRRVGAMELIGRTFFTFARAYFLQQGWRAGGVGAILALERSVDTYFKYAKVWEFEQRASKTGQQSRKMADIEGCIYNGK